MLSWNVNGRVDAGRTAQIAAVLDREPDVIALQELTANTYPVWSEALLAAGYSTISSIDLLRAPYADVVPAVTRKYFNGLAVRGTIAALPGLAFPDPEEARLAFPEKYIAARVTLNAGTYEIHNAHLPPGSSRGIVKAQAFRAIRRRTDLAIGRVVLCGDFNTPQHEDADGLTTWASSHPRHFEEWDSAEREVLENPALRDIYRLTRHASAPFAYSHLTRGTKRRYDHIYASPALSPITCVYHVQWLLDRLSDHAAVEADLEATP